MILPSFHHLSPFVGPLRLAARHYGGSSLNDSQQTVSLSLGGAAFSLQSKQPDQKKISTMSLACEQHAFLGPLPDTSLGCLDSCKHLYWLQEGRVAIV